MWLFRIRPVYLSGRWTPLFFLHRLVSHWLLQTTFDFNFSYPVSKRLFGFRLIRGYISFCCFWASPCRVAMLHGSLFARPRFRLASSSLPPFGRHHFAALMQRKSNSVRQDERCPDKDSCLFVPVVFSQRTLGSTVD